MCEQCNNPQTVWDKETVEHTGMCDECYANKTNEEVAIFLELKAYAKEHNRNEAVVIQYFEYYKELYPNQKLSFVMNLCKAFRFLPQHGAFAQ